MPIGFDTNILSAFFNPGGRLPVDPATGQPVTHPRERIEGLILQLHKEKQKVIVPTPVTAEILTLVGPTSAEYLRIINRSRLFEVRAFDELAAIELAFLNRDVFAKQDAQNRLESWQKIKIDRQILAICRVAQCTLLHTDDKGMIASAAKCGLPTKRIADLPIPDTAKQINLDLEPHEELPEPEPDNGEAGNGEPNEK